MLLLQDGQELGVSLKELNAEIMAAGSDGSPQGQNSQLLEITQLYDGFMKELQASFLHIFIFFAFLCQPII